MHGDKDVLCAENRHWYREGQDDDKGSQEIEHCGGRLARVQIGDEAGRSQLELVFKVEVSFDRVQNEVTMMMKLVNDARPDT